MNNYYKRINMFNKIIEWFESDCWGAMFVKSVFLVTMFWVIITLFLIAVQ